MKANYIIGLFVSSALLCNSCKTMTQQNKQMFAMQTGGMIGSVSGSLVGDRIGGWGGSLIGSGKIGQLHQMPICGNGDIRSCSAGDIIYDKRQINRLRNCDVMG